MDKKRLQQLAGLLKEEEDFDLSDNPLDPTKIAKWKADLPIWEETILRAIKEFIEGEGKGEISVSGYELRSKESRSQNAEAFADDVLMLIGMAGSISRGSQEDKLFQNYDDDEIKNMILDISTDKGII